MLHIRLRRTGKKKQPQYRLIVCEKSKDPWGDYLENLGTYNPRVHPSEINLKADRIKEWIAKGAQCSDTVWNMLVDQGVVEGEKRKTIGLSTKRKGKVAEKSEVKKAADEAQAKREAEKAAEAEASEPEAEKASEGEGLAAAQHTGKAEEAPAEEPGDSSEDDPAEEKKPAENPVAEEPKAEPASAAAPEGE
jgi:small subunit ribosomal protein S16